MAFKLDSFENNPIVKPQDLGLTWHEDDELKIGAVFNGGACIFQDKVILMPRCHQGYKRVMYFNDGIERYYLENYISEVWPLVSEDGINFSRFRNVVIRGDGTDHQDFIYGIEDIRIVKYNQRYLMVGCGKVKPPFKGGNADRIAVYLTDDFINITYHGTVSSFDSRNAVPFPLPVNGQHYMLLRFDSNIYLDFLEAGMEQLLNPSQHRERWEEIYKRRRQNLLLEAGRYPHEREKIGPSTQVIKTNKGWLLIYHAVGEIRNSICEAYGLVDKIERGYSICAALLDLDNPTKVICRTRNPIYIPSLPYELYGNYQYPVDVPAVVFPVGAIVQKDKLIIYAGAGDKYIILLSCNLDKLVNYLGEYCKYVT
ncbi:MAG: hypothetical protein HQ591_07105 [candidate division Zixibacteria bacterium]|nr:hypothetical protein [Candidatus Tariuqbacter arcticus]